MLVRGSECPTSAGVVPIPLHYPSLMPVQLPQGALEREMFPLGGEAGVKYWQWGMMEILLEGGAGGTMENPLAGRAGGTMEILQEEEAEENVKILQAGGAGGIAKILQEGGAGGIVKILQAGVAGDMKEIPLAEEAEETSPHLLP